MVLDVLHAEYYNIMVEDRIANASKLLTTISNAGVDFHAFKTVPVEPARIEDVMPYNHRKDTRWIKTWSKSD